MIACIVILSIFAILISFLLNFFFVKRIENKTYKYCMGTINVALSLVFIILVIVVGIVKVHLNSFIDMGINELENRVDEIYPGALEKRMKTEEIKKILENSIETKDVNGVEEFAENLIKSKIQKYTSITLKTINALERENNMLSVKDTIVSIKEICVKAVAPYFKIAIILFFILYSILIAISIFLTLHLVKDKDSKNEGVAFGEEADKTFIGMKTE